MVSVKTLAIVELTPDTHLASGWALDGVDGPGDGDAAARADALRPFGIDDGIRGLVAHPGVRPLLAPAAGASPGQAVLAGPDGRCLVLTAMPADGGRCRLLVGLCEAASPAPPAAGDFTPLLQDVIDTVPATLAIKDAQRRYLLVNRCWEAFAGLTRDQVIGRRFEDLAPPNLVATDARTLGGEVRDCDIFVLNTGTAIHDREECYVDSEGRDRTLLNSRIPLFGDDGGLLGVLSITMDITERKRQERELVQAKEAAEAANRSKVQFLSVMSHELRTPLQAVLAHAELGARLDGNPKATDHFRNVERHARALDRMIGEVLEFSSLAEGLVNVEESRFEPHRLAEDAMATQAGRVNGKPVVLDTAVDAQVPGVALGDHGRIREALARLLDNAIRFTEQGRVRLRVTSTPRQPGLHDLTMEVEDTGPGIAPDRLAAIFDAFSQADNSNSRRHGGLGLGLSVCRLLVKTLGGRMGVDSRPGEGSRFWFTVPVRIDDPVPASAVPQCEMPRNP